MPISTSVSNDRELWISFLEGNRESYAKIYETYFALLYEYGMRLCQNADLVKDSIQDLFIKLWINREHLKPTSAIKPYLYIALRSTILNKLDQADRRSKREDRSVGVMQFEVHYTIEDSIIFDEEATSQKKEILHALNNLTSRQKESIFLRFYVGLEYPEIAETMQISVKASYKIIGRAIEVMRNYFKDAVLYCSLIALFAYLFL